MLELGYMLSQNVQEIYRIKWGGDASMQAMLSKAIAPEELLAGIEGSLF
jgi:hypothetical protein